VLPAAVVMLIFSLPLVSSMRISEPAGVLMERMSFFSPS